MTEQPSNTPPPARPAPRPPRPPSAHAGGFTLLETGLALVIIVVGVLAITDAQRAFIQSNRWSSHEATATYLAGEVRELMRKLPRHDPVTGLSLQGGVVVGVGPEAGELTIDDFDDADDFHEAHFGLLGNLDGPIDAFGRVIPEVDADGFIKLDPLGNPLPLQGWSQRVIVEKVDPYDFSNVLDWGYEQNASGNFPGRTLDRFPLRITTTVFYQGPYDTQPQEVTAMTWIVPAR